MRGSLLIAVSCACNSSAMPSGDSPDANVGSMPDAPAMIGTWTADPACAAGVDDIYVTPTNLPPLTPAMRGDIVTCALGAKLDLAAAQMTIPAEVGVTATTGVRVIKLAYRTVRSDGTEAVSTASAYLPLVPRALPAPVILVGRSTSGIADSCAPSHDATPQENYALPFAARGFVTITPDFAGLGNEGTHAYLDNHEAANELFDAGRALKKLVPGNVVGAPVAAIGYSQGGGTVLSAQALEYQIMGTRTLKAVVAIAPEWPISTKSFDYEDVLRNPNNLTALAGLSAPTVTVLRQYGFAANRMGASNATITFPAGERDSIKAAIESTCTVQLGGILDGNQTHLGDLVDPTFRSEVLACIDGTAGCSGDGAAFHAWMTGDFLTADPLGAHVMIAQGLADQVMPAAKEAACVVAKLQAEGVTPALCTDLTATHQSIVNKVAGNLVAWIEATVDGLPPHACPQTTLPGCSR